MVNVFCCWHLPLRSDATKIIIQSQTVYKRIPPSNPSITLRIIIMVEQFTLSEGYSQLDLTEDDSSCPDKYFPSSLTYEPFNDMLLAAIEDEHSFKLQAKPTQTETAITSIATIPKSVSRATSISTAASTTISSLPSPSTTTPSVPVRLPFKIQVCSHTSSNSGSITEQSLFKQLPILSSFKPKYAKRETIDKKILRHFRHFIVSLEKSKKLNVSGNINKDSSFYILLINGEVFPPVNIYDYTSCEKIYFKSFNSSFLLWFFSKTGIKELYSKFIDLQGNAFVQEVSCYYNIKESERNQLANYVNNLPFIFDISLVNKITEKEGVKYNHLYRKKESILKMRKPLNKLSHCKDRSRECEEEEDPTKPFNTSSSSEE